MARQNLPPLEDDDEYYVIPVIPTEDAPVHTADNPFCEDPSCGCHEDPTLIGEVNDYYQAGELTSSEANDIVQGHRPL